MNNSNLIRITTIPISLDKLLEGQLSFMKAFYDVTAISSDEPLLQIIGQKENVDTVCIEMTRQITPFKDIIALWKLFLYFRKNKPTIVHTHTPKAGTLGMMASWLARVPIRLHTVAGLPLLEAKGNKRSILNFVEKTTYKCANYIYPNSYGLKDIIIHEKFCSPSKLKVIGNGSSNGINTNHFSKTQFSEEQNENLRIELNISNSDFVFIFVGRLVKDKGINELVNAFNAICTTNKSTKLLLVGPQEPDLDPLDAKTLEIIETNTNFISVGFQPDVRKYFAIADALVFPSYREGFPNVVMQAGAMELPSIVTDINGCNEIIVEGQNGTIIPAKDENALYEKMIVFLNDKEYLSTLRSNARNMITSRYEQKLVWNAILEEYKLLEKQYVQKRS